MSEDVLFVEDNSPEWVEIPRLEALQRLENMLTVDILSYELDVEEVETALGTFKTFTWNLFTEYVEEKPILLCMKDPDPDKAARWFLHKSLETNESLI